jgi:hypothetical protein
VKLCERNILGGQNKLLVSERVFITPDISVSHCNLEIIRVVVTNRVGQRRRRNKVTEVLLRHYTWLYRTYFRARVTRALFMQAPCWARVTDEGYEIGEGKVTWRLCGVLLMET